jgi:glycosyltransferase involved in cell wall biosynthesis
VRGASFSVALATYNGERFLAAQLASLAAQSTLPDELVVCDDRSTDGTLPVLEQFRADAPFPVRIHVNAERLGFAETFLRSAADCRGEWIAFCDQDDFWLDSKLERCGRELARDDVVLVVHTSRIGDADLRPTRRSYPDIRHDHLEPPLAGDPWRAVRGMSMAFAAELIRAADPARRPRSHYVDGLMHHDEWIYVLARALGTTSHVSEPLAVYRQHATNVTGAPRSAERVPQLVSIGATYYARRRQQAFELASVLYEIADRNDQRRERARVAAHWYLDQAAALGLRLSVYDREATAAQRLRRLLGLVRAGAYGSRAHGGFGVRGVLRDATMIALRRTG